MAIGELSLAVGHHMEKYLPDLVQNVKEYFSVKRCGVARTDWQMPSVKDGLCTGPPSVCARPHANNLLL
jgi:hypothetical protein